MRDKDVWSDCPLTRAVESEKSEAGFGLNLTASTGSSDITTYLRGAVSKLTPENGVSISLTVTITKFDVMYFFSLRKHVGHAFFCAFCSWFV